MWDYFKSNYKLIIALIIRFFMCLVFFDIVFSLIYCLGFYLIYSYFKDKNPMSIPLIFGIDFLIYFYYIGINNSMDLKNALPNAIYFLMTNAFLVIYLVNYIGENTTHKVLMEKSSKYIDKGLKNLQIDDNQAALEEFESAIKNYKKNYLGYLGACNTLVKMNKKELRKYKKYKSKCLKYAPKDEKENLIKRFQ